MALIMFRIRVSVFFLCSVLTSALCCDWLSHHSHLRNTSMVLIKDMGGPFNDSQTSPMRFPYNLYKMTERREVNSQLLFIRDSLKHIYDLYRYNALPAAWDAVKTKDFLESINRQIVELDQCVESGHKEKLNKKLKRYYKQLKNRIQNQNGDSSKGWELLRNETKNHLLRLDMLGNLLQANSRGRPAAHL
ncbi:interferon a3-like [Fundulus diaphanus]